MKFILLTLLILLIIRLVVEIYLGPPRKIKIKMGDLYKTHDMLVEETVIKRKVK